MNIHPLIMQKMYYVLKITNMVAM